MQLCWQRWQGGLVVPAAALDTQEGWCLGQESMEPLVEEGALGHHQHLLQEVEQMAGSQVLVLGTVCGAG